METFVLKAFGIGPGLSEKVLALCFFGEWDNVMRALITFLQNLNLGNTVAFNIFL